MRTPLDADCAGCAGHGRVAPAWDLCRRCDGLGREYVPGAPTLGCLMTLTGRPIGQVVTLGTGDRGRVVKHTTTGDRPITHVRLFDPFTGEESQIATPFPTACGVSIAEHGDWQTRHAPADDARGAHHDLLDPMRP